MADGHLNHCKQCVKERKAEYYTREKVKIQTKNKSYYDDNKEDLNEKMKSYYADNKDHIIEQHREYVKDNTEKVKTYQKEYRKNHLPKLNQQANIRWKRRRAKKVGVTENYTKDDRDYTMALFNHRCAVCGSTEALCIDHHYPLSKGHALTRENAVVLCNKHNCEKSTKLPEDFYTSEQLELITETLHQE